MDRYVIANVSQLLSKYGPDYVSKYEGLDIKELILLCCQVPSMTSDRIQEIHCVYDDLLEKYDIYRNLLIEDDDIHILIHMINYDFVLMIGDSMYRSASIDIDYDVDVDNIKAEKFIDDNSILIKVSRDEPKPIFKRGDLHI